MFVLWLIVYGVIAAARDREGMNLTNVSNFALRGLQAPGPPPAVCAPDLYEKWKMLKYTGALANQPSFWRYQTQVTFVLTKGLALDLAVAACKDKLELLREFLSGRSGPVQVQYAYKAMCTAECLQNDVMHQDALRYTGCSCTDLSTQAPKPRGQNEDERSYLSRTRNSSYHVPNDWCMQNSARMLCKQLGFCGLWNCKVGDFMCPRYEWNKKNIPLKGKGSCVKHEVTSTAGPRRRVGMGASMSWVTLLVVVIMTVSLALQGGGGQGSARTAK
jgi:hypothetical protein